MTSLKSSAVQMNDPETALPQEMDERSVQLRRMIIRTLMAANRGHVGSSMSMVEIFRVLYDDILNVRADEPRWEGRDRCILSKGHGCLTLYALLEDKGFIPKGSMETFCEFDSILGGHPEYGIIPGVEASTGALGHGLSIGLGMALAARIKKQDWRVFVVMGDGEIDEGSVWEAAMSAGKHGLENLVAIIDYNKIQSYGPTSEVQDLEPLGDKWRSFGFGVTEIDGHDVAALRHSLAGAPFEKGKPSALIAHTVKGKGIEPAEHNPQWHHKSRFKDEEIAVFRKFLGES